MLGVHFVYFAVRKSFNLVSARCDSTFCVTRSTMEDKRIAKHCASGLTLWYVTNGSCTAAHGHHIIMYKGTANPAADTG